MKFYGELLIFILLLITNLRVFFVEHVKRDPLVALAPFTLILSILQILAWGFEVFTALGFILSFLVLLSNFHAMFRYSEQLYIDHYSPLMKCWSIFTTILSSLFILLTLYFYPIQLNNSKIQVQENQTKLTGSFRTGFTPASPFSGTNGFLHEFTPQNNINKKEIILFIPDKRGNTFYYKPYLQLLAKEGFTVCSADFYSNDNKWLHSFADSKTFRRLGMCLTSLLQPQYFLSQREYFSYNTSIELKELARIIPEIYGTDAKIFIISDGMGEIAINDFAKSNPDFAAGILALNSIEDFKTSGYGFVEQTDPLLALVLGYKRDTSLSTVHKAVQFTKEEAQKAFSAKSQNSEIRM